MSGQATSSREEGEVGLGKLARVAMGILLLLAVASDAASARTTLVQWDWFDRSTKEGKTWWDYVEKTVEDRFGVDFLLRPSPDIEVQFPVAMAAGVPVDAVQVSYRSNRAWSESGFLLPLNDYLEASNITLKDFVPSSLSPSGERRTRLRPPTGPDSRWCWWRRWEKVRWS